MVGVVVGGCVGVWVWRRCLPIVAHVLSALYARVVTPGVGRVSFRSEHRTHSPRRSLIQLMKIWQPAVTLHSAWQSSTPLVMQIPVETESWQPVPTRDAPMHSLPNPTMGGGASQ